MKPTLMKTIRSSCGRYYSVNKYGALVDFDEGVIYSDNYKNIEFYLNEAKEDFPQYDWKIITFEIKEYEKDITDEIPELSYYRDSIIYNKNFNDTYEQLVGKKFKFKDGELHIIAFDSLPNSVEGILHRNRLDSYDQELYNFQGFLTNKDGTIEFKRFKFDYLLEEMTNQEILNIINKGAEENE